MYVEIARCRACGQADLVTTLSLGEQYLTGVFPRSTTADITKGPLDLVWCRHCNLLQMKQSYSLDEMYGENYGYRSGLNASMVRHLTQKMRTLEDYVKPGSDDLVLDIGSNDGTSLNAYVCASTKVGMDPTGRKFAEHYKPGIVLVPEFFSAASFRRVFADRKAKIITSIAMFYDLEQPLAFVSDIHEILADEGIWHFEQSYMPSMLRTNSYDTICHEHLEFYSLTVVQDILLRAGMRILDVQMNSINGGSFAITACKIGSARKSNLPVINWLLNQEKLMELHTLRPYTDFAAKVFQHRESLVDLLESLVADGKTIMGYGASTKGNVLLQFCGITTRHLSCIADVNPDKFGAFTPGTHIPIVSEADARQRRPDYFLVLPWHFKYGILERERDFMAGGGKLIFPMPEIEII
jgi:hypothetical protein